MKKPKTYSKDDEIVWLRQRMKLYLSDVNRLLQDKVRLQKEVAGLKRNIRSLCHGLSENDIQEIIRGPVPGKKYKKYSDYF